jgi:hypothetical protein
MNLNQLIINLRETANFLEQFRGNATSSRKSSRTHAVSGHSHGSGKVTSITAAGRRKIAKGQKMRRERERVAAQA